MPPLDGTFRQAVKGVMHSNLPREECALSAGEIASLHPAINACMVHEREEAELVLKARKETWLVSRSKIERNTAGGIHGHLRLACHT